MENRNRPHPDDPLRLGELGCSEQLTLLIALEQLTRNEVSSDEQAAVSERIVKHEAELAGLPPPNMAKLEAVVKHIVRTLAEPCE